MISALKKKKKSGGKPCRRCKEGKRACDSPGHVRHRSGGSLPLRSPRPQVSLLSGLLVHSYAVPPSVAGTLGWFFRGSSISPTPSMPATHPPAPAASAGMSRAQSVMGRRGACQAPSRRWRASRARRPRSLIVATGFEGAGSDSEACGGSLGSHEL